MDARRVDEVVSGFDAATLPPERLDHRAHLVVALAYVRRHGAAVETPFKQALGRYLDAQAGGRGAYHETITLAWLRLVAAFAEEVAALPLAEAAQRLCERYADKHALAVHYSRQRLMSDEARARWVAPDVEALPGAR